MDKTLFDIPIYWCDEATFNLKYDKKLEELHERTARELEARGFEAKPESIRMHDRGLWEQSMMPWRYNQVVGWIRIYRFGSQQLRGDWWLIKAKRLGWQRTKRRFFHEGRAFEMFLHQRETNKQIFKRIMQHLQSFEHNDLKRIKKTGHCILDLECFQNLGRFVNWRRLMNAETRQGAQYDAGSLRHKNERSRKELKLT